MTIRTRFSPSPTGMIHLGNARAALFSALYAKKNSGRFILRIEDSDVARSEERYIEFLQKNLHWLGISWQEGPGVEGHYGPYWQSQRQEIYAKYYHVLEQKNLVYPCFCSEKELIIARKLQLSRGQAPRYSKICRELTPEDIERRLSSGQKPALRFKVPANTTIEFIDTVKGPQRYQSDDIGDFIVRRADGTAPFMFCNAIDDATMEISDVLRGEDHLTNTPRQILLLKILDLHIPRYGHLSLIVGDDGAPLSKRHGSFSVQDFCQKGFLPTALINYLSRLGHSCDVQELLDFDHLATYFQLEKLSRSPARFDMSQLMHWQKMAVQAMDQVALWHWLGSRIENQVPEAMRDLFAKTVQSNIEFPDDALLWAKIFFHETVPIEEDALKILREAGEQYFVEAEQAIDKYGTDLPNVLEEMKSSLGISGKKLFMPMRIALTGKMHGPELLSIAELLGADKMKHRLGHAFKLSNQ